KKSGKVKSSEIVEAEKDLLRGQCNCAYWHGVFGGLYLFHLRRAIFHHLIKSESAMDAAVYGKKQFCSAVELDMDSGGSTQIILENRDISLLVSPAEGGAIRELDSKKVCQNLTNTLTRRKEAYHKKIIDKLRDQASRGEGAGPKTIHDGIQTVSEGIGEHLTYDWYNRLSLLDHFIEVDSDIESFSRCCHREPGDFVLEPYSYVLKRSEDSVALVLSRNGNVGGVPVKVEKTITVPRKGANAGIRYVIRNLGDVPVETVFAPEFGITMPDGASKRYSILFDGEGEGCRLDESIEAQDTVKVEIADSEKHLSWKLEISEKCRAWHFPIQTVSQSEKAYELNYQGSCIVPCFSLMLEPGKLREISLKMKLIG
ncbi:MAG: DUF1926 domain-containing protein, partial [Candidatus Omnitrophica bacterium]|nr:DUF1926 domain-containing protein [Candidatus Omnitrophota bacterium]